MGQKLVVNTMDIKEMGGSKKLREGSGKRGKGKERERLFKEDGGQEEKTRNSFDIIFKAKTPPQSL